MFTMSTILVKHVSMQTFAISSKPKSTAKAEGNVIRFAGT